MLAGQHVFSRDSNTFVLRAPMGNPFYAWPRTLLSYPLESNQVVSPASHTLRCVETGSTVPFQISRRNAAPGRESQRSLLFLSDLPAGETRTYRLVQQPSLESGGGQRSVIITHEEHRVTIDTGAIQIRIPASQDVSGDVPGPILEIGRGGKWSGLSKFAIAGSHITRIETAQIEAGPLRSAHRITYTIDESPKYVATVECVAGMDFVRLHEDMEALPAEALGEFDFAWTGCEFTHRQGPNHPYNFPRQPLAEYAQYPWEAIAPAHMDTQFGVSPGVNPTGEVPFWLRLYEPWGDALAACFVNFWSDSSTDAAAIFIDRMEQWEDHEYAIWHGSPRLEVEFVYRNSTLHFVWKIARGTRSTCVSFYDHGKDIEAMKTLEREYKGVESDGVLFRSGLFPTSYALGLQNWYGTLSLDKAKAWELSYASKASQPKPLFTDAPYRSADEFHRSLTQNDFVSQLALSGVRQNHGFGPTSSRQILESWVPGYQIFGTQLNQSQRECVEAIMLLLAYVHAGEDYMPMQRMLAGHPNFLSDVKSTPCGMAFLFPDHPAADSWADEYEAYLRMNTRYHTRPAVETWKARGGRWTENLGTYVWAFLRPASRGAFLLKSRDGQERLCGPQLAEIADWLVNALSAPFAGESPATMKRIEQEMAQNEGARRHYWGIVSQTAGPRRLHPPVGAHSERRKTPRTMWYLGAALQNYSPLTAEHVMWASRPTDQDMEATADMVDAYAVMGKGPDNLGTNPHLASAKYTGYGITLRAAVDTPQELSVHLMQIDDGPNYRWGVASEGSCGVIYFYANGKGYSHNGGEDAGDRIDQDTDFCTNFGVWKGETFRAIGQNVLSKPMYDLSVAQYAQIVPREGPDAYSWPEYVGRCILLAGDDYFLIHDQVFNPEIAHRFSWFVRKGDDFPHIAILTGNPREQAGLLSSVETETTAGRWVEGMGDSLALITHKEGIRAERAPFGARVSLAEGSDMVFASQETVEFHDGQRAFTGNAGIIRERRDETHIVLFHGTYIGAAGFSFTTRDADLGISAKISKDGMIRGHYFAPTESEVEIRLPSHSERLTLYIDGGQVAANRSMNRLSVKLPVGMHQWELSTGAPVPMAPKLDRTEYTKGGALIYGGAVASGTSYVVQVSTDNAVTWIDKGTAAEPVFTLGSLLPGKKYHVRLLAKNAAHVSEPGPEYPLYITEEAPPPPDGLHVELSAGEADITWGEVFGVAEYRLYRKKPSESQFVVVYAGRSRRWKDVDAIIAASAESPIDRRARSAASFIEYYVTCVNHIGESRASRRGDTDPVSWRNWNPTGKEPFRRTVEYSEGKLPNDGRGRYYPK